VNYLQALAIVSSALRHGGSDEPVRAGLGLALMAWRGLGANDPTWDEFGLAVLAAEELLRPYVPDTSPQCHRPERGDARTRGAVLELLHALTVRLERGAADESLPLAGWLARDAAAQQLRSAMAALQ
jgi:hypothetical protein